MLSMMAYLWKMSIDHIQPIEETLEGELSDFLRHVGSIQPAEHTEVLSCNYG